MNRKTSDYPNEILKNNIETITNDHDDENVYEIKIYRKQSGEKGCFRIFTGGCWKYVCRDEGCMKIPIYNHKGEKRGLYCSIHKKPGMINVKNKQCTEEGCMKQPSYNHKGEKGGLYCWIHKKEGMIDVKNKQCTEEGCMKQSLYNHEGEKRGLYCSIHKKEGMIDVMNKRCAEESCMKIPIYNHKWEKRGLYCSIHKKEGMINVKDKRCAEESCMKIPIYNHKGEKRGLYCSIHKKEGMIDVMNKRCNGYLCDTFAINKYDGYCIRCYIHMFPDKPVSRNFKTKETAVVNHIKQTFPNHDWVCDKQVLGGCSKKRPDMYCDFGYQIVIIEIDEEQHNTYESSCESKRCMEISKDFHHRPLIFLRFNPDKYKNRDGDLIRSCWSYNSNGISVVSKNKKKEWNNRLETLSTHIDFWTNPKNKSEKTVQIIELFFDGY